LGWAADGLQDQLSKPEDGAAVPVAVVAAVVVDASAAVIVVAVATRSAVASRPVTTRPMVRWVRYGMTALRGCTFA
jgi:hypothetical protein